MKRLWIHFCILCLVFIGHQFFATSQFRWAFADNYLDTFLLMPILLHLIAQENKLLFRSPRLHLLQVLIWTLAVSFVAEWLFPRFNPRFTSDWKDVVMYFLGSGYYLIFFYQNK